MTSRLNPREQIFVATGCAALAVALISFAIISPYNTAMTRLDQQLALRSRQLQDVKALRSEYLALQQQMTELDRLLGNRQDFSALTMIENLVERTAGREKLLSMRPQAPEARGEFTIDSIEVKLEKLPLKQTLEFLWGIEKASPPMQITGLYLKQRFDDRSLLDATMTVTALRRTR
jgi:type II secretory pathway component PulM